jgi:hypothetical protein
MPGFLLGPPFSFAASINKKYAIEFLLDNRESMAREKGELQFLHATCKKKALVADKENFCERKSARRRSNCNCVHGQYRAEIQRPQPRKILKFTRAAEAARVIN